jgi:hypothetical protein
MRINTHNGPVEVAHLVPTRGRAELMMKNMLKMQEVWNRVGTYLAIERTEEKAYSKVIEMLPLVKVIWYRMSQPTVGFALDVLRKRATDFGYDYYVMSDDNCVFTKDSFKNLVRATAEWPHPVHMAGAHGTAAYFHKRRMRLTMKEVNGIRSYDQMTWIFRCVSHDMYKDFSYPQDLPCYADRYFTMWLMKQGVQYFRATPDAPFTKTRFQKGGIGRKEDRRHTSPGAARILIDFPDVMQHLEVRFPWQEIRKLHAPKLTIHRKRD